MPFGGVSLTGYTVLAGAAVANGLVDAKTQFATTNSSYHPVRGPLNKDFPYSTRLAAPYNNIGTTRNANNATTHVQANSVVLNCFDCHNVPGTPMTLRTVAAHGNANTIRGTLYAAATGGAAVNNPTFCTTCHLNYFSSTSPYIHGTGSAGTTTDNNMNNSTAVQTCANCHSSIETKPARPMQAADVHGFNGLAATGGAWTWGNANGMRPVAFMRNVNKWTSALGSPRPYTAPGLTGTGATCATSGNMTGCGATMGTYSPGGTY